MNAFTHPTDDELQDWLDGTLPVGEAGAVAEHVADCDACRGEVERLRELLARLRGLPRAMAPPPELHAEARRRAIDPEAIGPSEPASAGPPSGSSTDLLPLSIGRRTGLRRGGLVAAAIALLVVGAIAGALLAPGRDGAPPRSDAPIVRAPASAGSETRSVTTEYDTAVERLAAELRARRDELDPATVRIVEENLRIVDRAIREAREALAADPTDPVLRELVVANYERKLDLLRRATRPAETL